jgi:hypothetical protein
MVWVDETDWWFRAAESAFAMLVSDQGFEIVERFRHFRGNSITYGRGDAVFILEAGADYNSLSGRLFVGPQGHVRGDEIHNVLAAVDPTTDWRYDGSPDPIDRTAMVAKMDQWAAGIVTHLPTLLAKGITHPGSYEGIRVP